jgi:hypothetical protein
MEESDRGAGIVIGLALIGPLIVGSAAFLAALVPFFNGEFIAAGVLLIASSLAFGLLAVAVLAE